MTSVLVQSAGSGHGVVNELPMEPLWYGVLALIAFLVLLGILWSFRNTLALDPLEHDDSRSQSQSHGAGMASDGH